jgi:hypothetical protein
MNGPQPIDRTSVVVVAMLFDDPAALRWRES